MFLVYNIYECVVIPTAHRPSGVNVKISSKGLALAGVITLATASLVAWMAIAMIVDSRGLTMLCGTTMTDAGIAGVSIALVAAGMLVLAGIGLLVMAWRSRQAKTSTKSGTAT